MRLPRLVAVALLAWTALAGAAAPQVRAASPRSGLSPRPARAAERTRLRQALDRAKGGWVIQRRFVPLRPGRDGAMAAAPKERLEVRRLGRALVVRSSVREVRDGQPGMRIEQLVRSVAEPAARSPVDAKARVAFQQVVERATGEFLRGVTLGDLHANALKRVAATREVDKASLYRAAMKGAASGIGDRYTQVFDPGERARWDARGKGRGIGVGVQLREGRAGVVVGKVVKGSPAHAAGLRRGDRLVSVEGRPAATVERASELLKGDVGARVRVEVARGGVRRVVEVARAEFRQDFLRASLHQGVGVVRLPHFFAGSADQVRSELGRLEQRHGGALRGLVLDLRGNPGGSRPEWLSLLNEFIPQGSLGRDVGQRGRVVETFSANPALARHADLPLTLLVDGHSASASERMAAVLKDRGRATIVGEPTFGKGVGQTTHPLADGSAFKVTNIQFELPSGGAAGVITPHVASADAKRELRAREPGRRHVDPVLRYAIAALHGGAPPPR